MIELTSAEFQRMREACRPQSLFRMNYADGTKIEVAVSEDGFIDYAANITDERNIFPCPEHPFVAQVIKGLQAKTLD